MGLLALLCVGVLGRMIYLQIMKQDFLQNQGDMRSVRIVKLNALRGIITDRLGEPLAVSTPVDSVWANPQSFQNATTVQRSQLAAVLGFSTNDLNKRLKLQNGKEFVYLKRQIKPTSSSASHVIICARRECAT